MKLDLIDSLQRKQAEEQQAKQSEKQITADQFKSITRAVTQSTSVLVKFLQQYKPTTSVDNFPDSISTPDIDKVVQELKALGKSLKPVVNDNSDVISSINKLSKELAKLPSKMPTTDSVEVTNLQELKNSFEGGIQALQKAIEAIEVKPKVTVPKAQITVEKTNVAGLIKEVKKVAKEVREKPITPVSVTPTDPLIRFTPVNMDDSSTVQYYSYIATSGEFYIRKVDKSGAYTTIRFYWGNGGAGEHDTAWTGRAGLTYTMWSQ
jgi:hypothetical protein